MAKTERLQLFLSPDGFAKSRHYLMLFEAPHRTRHWDLLVDFVLLRSTRFKGLVILSIPGLSVTAETLIATSIATH